MHSQNAHWTRCCSPLPNIHALARRPSVDFWTAWLNGFWWILCHIYTDHWILIHDGGYSGGISSFLVLYAIKNVDEMLKPENVLTGDCAICRCRITQRKCSSWRDCYKTAASRAWLIITLEFHHVDYLLRLHDTAFTYLLLWIDLSSRAPVTHSYLHTVNLPRLLFLVDGYMTDQFGFMPLFKKNTKLPNYVTKDFPFIGKLP